ncbi:hypothetical protein GYMLUDRAFT_47663 [Collybiopsis luxurians FD-317 M1]|uniref:FHA domain-containing protein n=1 Tax=Collybiopsis luxurians FD-317 M1 TaxID=944289 RepID=A0A0D0BLN6_9AGAR|nr:hypothetical protein GYMLUDRAFT_47663 [Collybiopsis luxurians FD-317 M1]
MWVLRGPFDVDPVTSLESKLRILKPSKSYLLGRKKTPYPQLIINNKKFSHEHCKFSVGQFTREDVVNPHKKPTLEITNLRDKPISIRRNVKGEDGTIVVNGKMTVKLQDGDEVLLVGGMKPIAIFWRFNMFLYRPNSAQLESCASLGITISQIPQQSELGSSSPVSHHILPSFAITPAVGISLLSRASFVKVEWLNRFIELYNNVSNNPNANNPDMHPDTPPDLADPPLPLEKFRPSFPSTLDAKYKNATVWEPNEARSDFFKGFRFLLVCEKDRDLELGLREFLKCGGGAVDTFRVSEGRSKFKRALKQGLAKGDTMLVLVGDEGNVKAAIGDDEWRELEAEAKEYNLRLFTLVDIVYAVLDVDTEVLKSVPRSEIEEESQAGSSHPPPSSFLPSYVPNSIPEEMTVPPPTAPPPPPTEDPNELHEADVSRRRPLQRRKPLSRQVSVAPEESTDTQPVDNNAPSEPAESEEPAPAPARRKPTRRVRGGVPIVTGLGDSSMVIDAIEAANAAEIIPKTEPPPTAAPMILDLAVDPTPIRSSRPLKRRQGPSAASSSSATFSAASEEEPPHKKYKALFEATNDPEQADMLMSQLPQEDYAGSRQTQSRTQSETQSQTGSRKTQSGASRSRQIQLDPVPEEGSSQFPSSKQTQSRKRKVVHSDDEDREMAGVEQELAATGTRSRGGSVAPPSKKQATEKVNAVEPVATASVNGKENASSKSQAPTSKKGSKGAGAVPSQPDTDPSFLKAVASTKRGKKNEDEFDREFNQLRISKPNTKDAQSNREEEDWAILNRDDFELEDGQNLRGNFMVIVEMDVHRDRFPEADKDRERREKESREKWAGVPNFKKFKKASCLKLAVHSQSFPFYHPYR